MDKVESARTLARVEELEQQNTQLRAALASHAASERRYVDIFQSAVEAAIVVTDVNGVVSDWNAGAEHVLGWPSAQMLGQTADRIFTPEDLATDRPRVEMQLALQSGRAADERWHLKKDGTRFWASGELTPLRAADGTHQGFVKILRDRTAQHMAGQALREARGLSTLVFNSGRDCTVVLDLEGHTLSVSPGGIESMEISDVHRIIGLSWLRVWSGADHDAAVAAVADARAGRTGRFQGFCATHKGTPKWWDVVISPILGSDGNPERLVSVGRDITDAKAIEQRLALSEERLSLALGASGMVGIWDWDLKADRVYADANFARIYTVDPAAAAQGAPLSEYIKNFHPDDLPEFQAELDRLFAGAEDFRCEYRIIQPDGSARWLLARGRLVRDEDGVPLRFPGASVDITDRKQAEVRQAFLLDLSDQIRTLSDTDDVCAAVEQALLGHLHVSDVAFAYVQTDGGLSRLHSTSADDLSSYLQFEASSLDGDRRAQLHLGQTVVEHGVNWTDAEASLDTSAPTRRAVACVPLLHDGKLMAVLCVGDTRARCWSAAEVVLMEDVAGRTWDALERLRAELALRATEHALRASEVQFRTVAQAMPNHVWTATPDGLLDWFNERVYQFSGAEAGTLDGQGWTRMVHPDDIGSAAERWAFALASGAPYETEFRLQAADGTYRWHIARAVPVKAGDGEITHWVGTNTDIEDQKVTAQALANLNETLERMVVERTEAIKVAEAKLRQAQKMEAVGQLTGGVAHDFNNILQVISGNLQLIARYAAGNEKAESRVAIAKTAVTRGAKLASQLLAFSRRQPLEPKVVKISRMVASMEDMLHRAIGEAIEIETVVSAGLWNTLIDPTQIEDALLNLAINARDAMAGSGKLTIEMANAYLDSAYASQHAEVEAGQYVMVAVSDTGCGMPAEVIAKAFEPFFSTKPEGRGTGLGLSMVYGFVKQSGGHVAIYSELGLGTTIKLYLPRAHGSEDIVTEVDGRETEGGTETILVAEDDDEVRSTVVTMLTELGYRVLKAADAGAALNIIESGVPIDLLFTDVVMPGSLKSPELARKARERLPNLAVLFTSGYTQNAIVHGGRLDAGVELLTKPYTSEELAGKVRHVLANRSQRGRIISTER